MDVQKELKDSLSNPNSMFGSISPDKLVLWAKEFNIEKDKFKSTQFRKFYDAVRAVWDHPKVKKLKSKENIDEELRSRLIFLRPHIIKASKEAKLGGDFGGIMDFGLQRVRTKEDLYKFVKFFESIIAYAK